MHKTILLADDSPTIRKIVELTFQDTEVRVETVESGAEALRVIDSVRPDLVLADVVMPEPTGYEICRRIKESERPVPVLLLAGAFEPLDEELAVSCSADGHLVKPFEAQVLRDRVEQLLSAGRLPAPAAPAAPAEPQSPRETSAEALSPEFVRAVAREMVSQMSPAIVREIAKEILPDVAREVLRRQVNSPKGGSESDDS